MLTDVRHRQLVPTCFAGDVEIIAPIIQDNGTGPDGQCETLPAKCDNWVRCALRPVHLRYDSA